MILLNSSYVKSFVYILFVYSGMIKWLPLPVDPTLLFGILATVIIVFSLLSRKLAISKHVFVILFLLISFALYSVFTSVYSPSQIFWKQKALSIILLIITLVYPVICFKNHTDFDKIIYIFRFVSTTAALIIFVLLISGNLTVITGSRVGLESSGIPDYLVIGELLGIGVLSYLYGSDLICKIFAFFIFSMLVLLGARGPFLFVIIVSSIYFSLVNYRTLLNLKSSFILVFFGCMFWLTAQFWSGAELLITRLSVFSDFSQDESSLERIVAFQHGFNAFIENPFWGLGLGGYGPYAYQVDENVYPHNILIEIGAELGVFGLALFVAGMIYVFKLSRRHIEFPHMQIYFAIFLFVALNYLKSGGLIDARKLFITIGIIISYGNFRYTIRS